MDLRVLASCSLLALVAACGLVDGEQPPSSEQESNQTDVGAKLPPPSNPSGDAPPTEQAPPSGGSSSGNTNTPPPKTSSDIFTGAPAYKGTPPAETANSHHFQPMTGRDCFQCHGRLSRRFDFAGTAYDAQGQPMAGAEIRVVDAENKEIALVTTDADGNFWAIAQKQFPSPTPPKVEWKTAIRTSKGTMSMVGTATVGGCNSTGCHDDQKRIVAP